jgi:hypothetical protein
MISALLDKRLPPWIMALENTDEANDGRSAAFAII